MNKNQKEEQRRQEDLALNRGLVWVGAAIVLELLLLLVNKYYIDVYTTSASVGMAYAFQTGLQAVRVIALAGMAACAVWTWLNVKKSNSVKPPVVLLIGCGVLSFCAHVALSYKDSGLRMLFLLVPALAALALVFYLYQREFFLCAAFSGLGVVTLWLIRHRASSALTMYLFLAIMAVVLVAGFALLNQVRQNEGVVTVNGKKTQFLPKDANYTLVFATALVNVVAVALGLLLGGTIAYYLVYALVACLFGLLVYYTVKMM